MKTTTFKNICSPSDDKSLIIGTNYKNQRWFFAVDSRRAAASVAKAIMAKKGKVSLNGWTPYTLSAHHQHRIATNSSRLPDLRTWTTATPTQQSLPWDDYLPKW